MKKINFFLAFVLYFSLQIVGCNIDGGSSPLIANCEWRIYNTSGSIRNSGRSNCEVDGDVLTMRLPQTGQLDSRLNKATGTFISQTPPATYEGQVTTSDGDKNWTFTYLGYKLLEVIIDGGSSTNDGSSTTTPLIANCEWKIYNTSGTITSVGRSNCEVNGDVLATRLPQTGQLDLRLNKATGALITQTAIYEGQVTTSNGDKNWTFIGGGIKLEVIID